MEVNNQYLKRYDAYDRLKYRQLYI